MSTVASPTGTSTQFRVLGPVSAVRSGQAVRLGGPQQRRLLAMLLVEPGQVVSSDRLVDELWHGDPPGRAESTLRVHASRLRTALGGVPLVARPPGYALDVDPGTIDASRFEGLLAEGRQALARGAAGLATERLSAALALWQGPAFADVREGDLVGREAARLDELRLDGLAERIEAELSLGRHASLVAELEDLVAEEPLRERFWQQLVLALYHSGRQAEALAAYGRARTLLSESLGIDPSAQLQALERAVLRQELEPVSSPSHRHNLTSPLTSFVGRVDELDDVAALLRAHRLVTLTGVGGAGKTRLAVEVAARQVGAWQGGVWLVDLSVCTDPETTARAVAGALDVRERPGVSVVDSLIGHLRGEELLLVLDNCEHVVTACADLAQDLLSSSPSLRILATSRVPLAVWGEVDFMVEPLATPPEGASDDEVERAPSARLFLERVRAIRRDVGRSSGDLETISRICRELDGLPLAIELAAARTKTLALDDVADRLGDRFRLLRSNARQLVPRHQTLRATIDWSFNLLGTDERELLRRLSVFAGGFTLDAAAAVCADGDRGRAEDLIGTLVESSLVVVAPASGSSRYGLLQTIRDYASELVDVSGTHDGLHQAHAEHFLEIAERTRTEDGEGKARALELLDRERENLHSAMRWSLEADGDLALRLAAVLWRYWLLRGHRRQGLVWLERALREPGPPGPARAMALAGAALLARLVGDFAAAGAFAREGVTLGREVGPTQALSVSLNVLTTLAARDGDFDRARRHANEATDVARAAGDIRLEALALFILAEGLLHAGRYADVREVGGRALTLARSAGDPEVTAIVLARLGIAAAHERWIEVAAEQLAEALSHARDVGIREAAAWCCDGLALVAAHTGEYARAARLLGASESLLVASGTVVEPAEAAAREAVLATLQQALAPDELQAWIAAGRGLGLEEAAAEALAVAGGVTDLQRG